LSAIVARGLDTDQPISERAGCQAGCLPIFLGIFGIFGLTALVWFFLPPIFQMFEARSWVSVPCRIVSSRVSRHPGGRHGPTFSIDVVYTYSYNGQSYQSNRYEFMGGSSSGEASKQLVVRQLSPGSTANCFVNPADPTQAVMVRGLSLDMLAIVIPLTFAGVGIGGIIWMVRLGRRFKTGGFGLPPILADQWDSPLPLKSRQGPAVRFWITLGFALFFNCFLSIFFYEFVAGYQLGAPDSFLGLKLIPLGICGLALIIAFIYSALGLFDPRPRLVLQNACIWPGSKTELHWQINGRYDRINHFRLWVEGREWTMQQTRGRNRGSIQKEVVATINLFDSIHASEFQQGNVVLVIPSHAMHSFIAFNNKIQWFICVRGEIAHWPKMQVEFPLIVRPRPLTSGDRRESV
jgi:hypothetical protein